MKKIISSLAAFIFSVSLCITPYAVYAADSEEYAYTKDAVDFMTNEKELQSLISYIKKQIKLLSSSSYKSAQERILRDKYNDASVWSYVGSQRALAEMFYDNNENSYKGFCKSSEMFKMKSALKDNNTVISCTDSKTEYRLSATLSTKKLFCADSLGNATEVRKINKNSFACK